MTISTISSATYPYSYVAGTTTTPYVAPSTGTTDTTDTDQTTPSTTATSTDTGTTGGTTDSTSSVSTELQALLSAAQQANLNDVSVLLGTSSDDLFGSLSTGSTLSDLMSQANLNPSLLATVISNGLLLDTSG